MREDIEFQIEDGVTLRGWHYALDGVDGAAPLVVMSHGYSAVKEMYLDDFAEHFAAGGLGVLVYDNRNLGASDGTPARRSTRGSRSGTTGRPSPGPPRSHGRIRADRDLGLQLQRRPRPRGRRPRSAGPVRRLPGTPGQRAGQRPPADPRRRSRRTRQMFDADRAARYAGKEPGTIQVVWDKEPTEACALPTEDSHDFFLGPILERATAWRNEVTSIGGDVHRVRAGRLHRRHLADTADDGRRREGPLTVVDLALEYFERAREPKELLVLPGGHFEAYVRPAFDQNAPAQLRWFQQHLA